MRFPTFRRVRYVEGQVLTADTLQDEQEYLLGKIRLQNRLWFGCGAVCGLSCDTSEKEIRIEPGVALDCMGREILIVDVNAGAVLDVGGDRQPVSVQVCGTRVLPAPEAAVVVIVDPPVARGAVRAMTVPDEGMGDPARVLIAVPVGAEELLHVDLKRRDVLVVAMPLAAPVRFNN